MSRERNDAYSRERMTAKQINMRKAQRRRKRKLRQLRFFLVLFMLVAVVVLSLTVFFKIDTIKITGETRYSHEEIIEKSGLVKGKNLFLYNIAGADDVITQNFVYIENVKIKKHLPGIIEVVVSEAKEVCTIEIAGGYFVVSDEGKVLEKTLKLRDDLYNVKGIDMSKYKVGDNIKNDKADSVKALGEITKAIDKAGMSDITFIDLSDIYNIEITYQNRVKIKCGTQVELDYKLKYAKTILAEKIGTNEEGTLDVSYVHTTENAVFSPKRDEITQTTSSETSSDEQKS